MSRMKSTERFRLSSTLKGNFRRMMSDEKLQQRLPRIAGVYVRMVMVRMEAL